LDDGRCRLRDCGSTYGTFVLRNGHWEKIREAVVDHDDFLRFGNWQASTKQLVTLLRINEADQQAQAKQTSLNRRRPERRLTAILFADVVGYVRLMEDDESGTLAALKSHFDELINPKISECHGVVVKSIGDGVMAEFGSVIDAVQCADEIQKNMAERNGRVPNNRRMLFRIGINLGDVVIDAGDIYGQGVNIASRLEGFAEPGGICVTATVYDQVKHHCDLHFDDLGGRSIKNLPQPVHIYASQGTA
jgi:class 3 adenylate cyclase